MTDNYTNIDNHWMGKVLKLQNPYEREVFAHIYHMTVYGRGGWMGSVRELAARLFYSTSTIARAIKSLIEKKLIRKDEDCYSSVPLWDTSDNLSEMPEPQEDTFEPIRDTTDPMRDSLSPTPPITNKIITKKEEKRPPFSFEFEKFWTIFNVESQYTYLKDACHERWEEMNEVEHNLIFEDLQGFPNHEPSPKLYLAMFRPRSPIYVMRDEVEARLKEGDTLVYVELEDGRRKIAAYKEAETFKMKIIGKVRLAA